LVTGNYFQVLGVTPALGRVFTADDETAPGANPVAVLGYGYWMRRVCGGPEALNKRLRGKRNRLPRVGVAHAGFNTVQVGGATDVFIPITMKPQMTPNWDGLANRKDAWVAIMGRLKPGVTAARAQAALAPAYHAIMESETAEMKLGPK